MSARPDRWSRKGGGSKATVYHLPQLYAMFIHFHQCHYIVNHCFMPIEGLLGKLYTVGLLTPPSWWPRPLCSRKRRRACVYVL